jgi:hypothetical protein
MVRRSVAALGVVGALVTAVGAWNLRQRYATEEVPYAVVGSVDGVELRRYPPAVLAEAVAPSEREAFWRLFRYITGANRGADDVAITAPVRRSGESIPMTAPVAVGRGRGRSVPMTAPVEADERAGRVRMAFYLPAEYDVESAPHPTEGAVELVAVPERTLAVRRFSWWPTDGRVERETDRLLSTVEHADVRVAGEPFFMGYEGPGTLPFLRRNEVAVEVERAT